MDTFLVLILENYENMHKYVRCCKICRPCNKHVKYANICSLRIVRTLVMDIALCFVVLSNGFKMCVPSCAQRSLFGEDIRSHERLLFRLLSHLAIIVLAES
jgi:hypothetical protein